MARASVVFAFCCAGVLAACAEPVTFQGGDGGGEGEGGANDTGSATGTGTGTGSATGTGTGTGTGTSTGTGTGTGAGPGCGDGVCDAGETCTSCAADCGACPPTCGDGNCDANETCSSCAADCGPCASNCAHDPCDEGGALVSGCDPCVTQICSVDTFCCSTSWDSACVSQVTSVCGQTCSGGGACAHDMCLTGGALMDGCDPCVSQVCAVDSFCCTVEWDIFCVDEVSSVCGLPC